MIYIALLRGINVGGKNIIKMADLRHTFETLGFKQVKTYIQSGNVLFESDDDEDSLRQRIEHEIESDFGISLTVILRTVEEIERIIENCPFDSNTLSENDSIQLSLGYIH
ncbi:MAG: hypothetical protein JWN30_523 [Bacilli bacterium]|nr:hypothetical protein [Bacilli bacterium]